MDVLVVELMVKGWNDDCEFDGDDSGKKRRKYDAFLHVVSLTVSEKNNSISVKRGLFLPYGPFLSLSCLL